MVVERYPWWHPSQHLGAFRQTFGTARTDRAFQLHCHAYSEAFWIEKGRCLHTINGRRQILVPGDLTFIRAEDVHTGAGMDDEGFTLVNVSFPPGADERMRKRHAIGAEAWPWWRGPQPRTYHLAPEQMRLLAELIAHLPSTGFGTLEGDLVLLALVQAARGSDEEHRSDEAPPWLRRALQDDEVLREGIPALERACGKSAAHVNRTVRRCFGVTATDLLNRRRLDHAASALRLGAAGITEVALDAGFNNLAWFHRAFRARFGTTPRRWRLAVQRPAQPGGTPVARGA